MGLSDETLFRLYPACLKCGTREGLTRDHVVPLSRGGADALLNKQVLCYGCNNAKGAETADYRPEFTAAELLGVEPCLVLRSGSWELAVGGRHGVYKVVVLVGGKAAYAPTAAWRWYGRQQVHMSAEGALISLLTHARSNDRKGAPFMPCGMERKVFGALADIRWKSGDAGSHRGVTHFCGWWVVPRWHGDV